MAAFAGVDDECGNVCGRDFGGDDLIVGDHLEFVAGVVDHHGSGEAEGAEGFEMFGHFAVETGRDFFEIAVTREFVIYGMLFGVARPD